MKFTLECPRRQCIWSLAILLYLHTIFGCFFATKTVWPASPKIITISLLQKAVYWLVPKCAVFSVAHENVPLIIHTLGGVLILKVWSLGPDPSSLDKLSMEASAPASVCWGDRSRDWVFSIVFSGAPCSRSACTTRDSVCTNKHLPCVYHVLSLHVKQNMGIFSWLLVMSVFINLSGIFLLIPCMKC